MEIIAGATDHAREHDFGNHRVWWKFSQIVSQIPSESVSLEFLDSVDYWLDDKYETSLVANEIGMTWLVKLLEEEESHSLELATKLLEILYKVRFGDQHISYGTQKAALRSINIIPKKLLRGLLLSPGVNLGNKLFRYFTPSW